MACRDYDAYYKFLIEGQVFDAIYCPFGDALGGPMFALIFFGGILTATYVYSDGPVLPLTMVIILGSVVVTQLPSVAVQVVVAALLLVVSGLAYTMIQRRSP